jgi:integrase
MASIRKRALPSGEIRWLVDYRDRAGKRRAKMFETKRDADAYMVKARAEVAAGTHVPESQSVTVSEAADLWVRRGESDGLEATTVRQRRQHADLHIKPLIGATKLSRVSAPVVQEFVDRLLETRSRAMSRRVRRKCSMSASRPVTAGSSPIGWRSARTARMRRTNRHPSLRPQRSAFPSEPFRWRTAEDSFGSRAAVVARLMVRLVCPQLRKCRVRPVCWPSPST